MESVEIPGLEHGRLPLADDGGGCLFLSLSSAFSFSELPLSCCLLCFSLYASFLEEMKRSWSVICFFFDEPGESLGAMTSHSFHSIDGSTGPFHDFNSKVCHGKFTQAEVSVMSIYITMS